jgi:high-affinity nickel permease
VRQTKDLERGRELGDSNETAQLVLTLVLMGVLLVICIVAVVIFFRVWRKENKGRGRNFFE